MQARVPGESNIGELFGYEKQRTEMDEVSDAKVRGEKVEQAGFCSQEEVEAVL